MLETVTYKSEFLDQRNFNLYLRNLIEEIRLGRDENFKEVEEILKTSSNCVIYKFLGVLRPYGYDYESIMNTWRHYLVEFLEDVEFPLDNIRAYYNGYIHNKFCRVASIETVSKRQSNCENLHIYSSDEFNNSGGIVESFRDEEVLTDWVSINEIYQEYILNDKQKLLNDIEKMIIIDKVGGESFIEISEKLKIPYKQVSTIFKEAILKLKLKFCM